MTRQGYPSSSRKVSTMLPPRGAGYRPQQRQPQNFVAPRIAPHPPKGPGAVSQKRKPRFTITIKFW